MDSLKGLSNDTFDSLKVRSFGGPISARTRTILLSSKNDGGDASILVSHSSIIEVHHLIRRDMEGLRTYLVIHFVNDASVGEGASSHDLVIASSGTIRVVVFLVDVLFT
jgi:hypothetical protein